MYRNILYLFYLDTVKNYITPEECEHMIKISKDSMSQSLVSYNGGGDVSQGRTSKNAWINFNWQPDDVSKFINAFSGKYGGAFSFYNKKKLIF